MELKGIGVSPGVAVGPALVVEREAVPVFRLLLAPEAVEGEVQRLSRAVEASQKQLLGIKERLARLPGSFVLVTEDLTPSEAAELDWERVLAVTMDAGSPTHHTAILARSFGIPAVAGLQDAVRRVPPGSLVVVDGTGGRLVVEPTAPTLEGFRAVQERHKIEEERLQATSTLPAVTRDGIRVRLQANADFPDEADTALLYGAEGIGLFRSEYLLGRSREWPAEKRQLEVYRRLVELMG